MASQNRLVAFLFVSFSVATTTSLLFGQANTASIRGTVSDASGAVVPGVQVKLTNTGTGVPSFVKTNDAGDYLFQFLPPGNYRIEAEVSGFKKFVQENVTLDLARQLRIDVALQPGQVSETIDVTAAPPLVDTENGSLGTTVQNQMLTSLPNLSRNPQTLQLLSPGTINDPSNGIVTNGGLVRIDPYYIDGLDSSNHVWSGTPVNPNPDVIQEFKTLTNSYSAEYGESSAATMIATTKSGTNSFHGTLFEFWQNDALNAGDFFAHTTANLRYNQFGGTGGGPIKKNKTFFFVDTQLTRQKSAAALTNLTVPSAAFRAGNFSSLLGSQVGTDATGGAVYQDEIFDPNTQRQLSNGTWVRDPFPGNVIPISRLSPAALKVQALYPAAQLAQNFNNYSTFGASTSDTNEWDVKLDHIFADSDRISVRYSEHDNTGAQPSAFGYAAGGGPQPGTLGPGDIIKNNGRQAVLNYVHIFGPQATNDLMLGWQNQYPNRTVPGYGTVSQNDLGIYGLPDGAQKIGTPYFSFNNFEALGATPDTLFFEWQTQDTLTDTFSLVIGRHNLRMGGEVRKLLTNNLQPAGGGMTGSWYFNTDFTNQPGINGTGFDYASFLLGLPYQFNYDIFPDYFRTRASVYAAFVQDDFHITRKLTLNLGLRWDAPTWFHEALNRSGTFDLSEGQYVQFGVNGFRTTPWNNDWANFDPRFGFAYSPFGTGKLVLRGGYGIFVVGTDSAGSTGFMLSSPIFADSDLGRYTTVDQVHWQTTLDSIPYQPVDKTGKNASSVTVYPAHNPMAYVQQFNTNVQTELKKILVEVGYVGTRGVHLSYGSYNLNAIPVSQAPQAQGQFISPYVPYPQYPQGVTIDSWIGSSDYNSLQIRAERRYANGLAFILAFTHSKFIDVGDAGYREPTVDRNLDRGLNPENVPNRFVAGYNYQLPFGPGHPWLSKGILGNVIGGWEINGTTTYQSGFSLTPGLSNNNCVCGNSLAVPNVSGNPMTGPQTLNEWFNTSVFSYPAEYTIGNSGRGIIGGPHVIDTDVNLAKRFKLPWREGMSLEFRGEFFNAFNHPQFNNPDVNLGDANFGKITSAINPRQGQLALKLYW